MKRNLSLALVAILLVSSVTLGYSFYLQNQPFPTPIPTSTPSSVGICVHSLSQTEAKLVADSGAGWIRIDISNNQTNTQASLENAKKYNLSVLGILGSWMFNQSCTFSLDEWRQAVTSNVTKYAPYIDAWEIWNEPTSTNPGWQLQTDYLSMIQIASPIIRQYDPTAKILLFGGLQLYTGGNTTLLEADKAFAQNLSSYNIMQYGDAISVHAYPWGADFSQNTKDTYIASLRDYRVFLGNSSLDIWVTETGQNVTTASEEDQAQYLNDSLGLFNGSVSHVFWYALYDENASQGDFGLINQNMQPRDAYNALQGQRR